MTLKVISVGAGYFAAFHQEAWKRHADTELIAAVDPNLDRAKAVGVPAFPSLHAALEAVQADIIDISAPPPAHDALVREALAARPHAIICQKPFATSIAEGEALAQTAEAAGIPLIIHENFRFQPWYRKAREFIDEGSLGKLHQATFRFRTGDGRGPDAYLDRQPAFQTMPRLLIHETAVHWIDTFRYLLGPIESVYADLRQLNPAIQGEDAGYVLFTCASGARAVFDGNRLLDHDTANPRLTFGEALIEAEEATLSLTGDGALTLRRFGQRAAETVLAARNWPGFAGDCVYAVQAHVVAALQGTGCLENEARDYLTVRRVEEAIYLSNQEKRRVDI
ncbi:MAG: Gfo/Idh/MocA family oxidoreductase [Pseudomonadota bacterium]